MMLQIFRHKTLLAERAKIVLVQTLDKLKRIIVITILTVIIYVLIYNVNKFVDLLNSDYELQLVLHDTIVSFLYSIITFNKYKNYQRFTQI